MNKSPNTNEAEAQVGTSSTQNEATKAKTSKTSPFSSSTSRSVVAPWMRLNNKDPRIVRVSRAFGGKDRHSKVCTVRGLRDRRMRLSVPTAIQLYDLQDRLGLNQPSKVVDWLIDAAKDDIDELPPLPMMSPPPGSYSGLMNHHHSLMNMTSDQSIIGANIWRPANEESQENKDGEDEDDHGKERSNVLMTRTSSSSATNTNHPLLFSGLVNNSNAMASYNFNNWDQSRSSSFPLPHQVGCHGFTPHDFNAAVLPSALSLATGTTQPYFPSSNATTTEAADQNIYIGRRFEHHIHSSSHHHQDFLARSLYHPRSQQRNATPQNLMGMITSKISETNNDHEHPSSR